MLFTLQCTDSVSDSQLPTVQYNFRHIADLENVEPNQLVGESTVYKTIWSKFDIKASTMRSFLLLRSLWQLKISWLMELSSF